MARIFSGIQPTNFLHMGNYLGALSRFVSMQEEHKCFFSIVDLHALTVQTHELKEKAYHMAACFLAAGLDSERSTIFVQSHVRQHSELAWILNCNTPIGWLKRMTQFKDKSANLARSAEALGAQKRNKQNEEGSLGSISTGLLTYPCLMAADILLYKTQLVPVGEDQKQHVEFTRDLAQRINQITNSKVFEYIPEPLVAGEDEEEKEKMLKLGFCTKLMSLRDGNKKMSKSDTSEQSYVSLQDSPDQIKTKIAKSKSDSYPIPQSKEELKERVEAKNLLTFYSALNKTTLQDTCDQWSGKSWSEFKPALAEIIIETTVPFQEKVDRYLKDRSHLDLILEQGAQKASDAAEETLEKVKEAINSIS